MRLSQNVRSGLTVFFFFFFHRNNVEKKKNCVLEVGLSVTIDPKDEGQGWEREDFR